MAVRNTNEGSSPTRTHRMKHTREQAASKRNNQSPPSNDVPCLTLPFHQPPTPQAFSQESPRLRQAMPDHPIFLNISLGDLEAVKAHVLADSGVLWERGSSRRTPVMHAICGKPAIALWLIDHQHVHNLRMGDLRRPAMLLSASLRARWQSCRL